MSALTRQRAAEAAGVAAGPPPPTFTAKLGWKRTFLSQTDADKYDEGFAHWPNPLPHVLAASAPFSTGWLDAEHSDQVRVDQIREQRADDREARADERREAGLA